jgi:hypothetical protein
MKLFSIILLLGIAAKLYGQNANVINTAVPFLRISPDARSSGLGDAGVATTPDVHSIFWNTAKLAFSEDQFGFAATYTPWLNVNPNGTYLFDASSFWKIDSLNVVTVSARFFTLGNIIFTNANDSILGSFNPNEYTFHAGYARKLSRNFSAGINIGYVRSNIAKGFLVNNEEIKPGVAVMSDLSVFYSHPEKRTSVFRKYNLGLTISNLGNKISYIDSSDGDFLPANIRLGSGFFFQFGNDHQLSFTVDLNKLLVPTPDSAGNYLKESVLEGAFKSFADAPGGLSEELKEINVSSGVEYWFRKMIALRTGYFYESSYKGDRQYFTFGAGVKYKVLELDGSYSLSTNSNNAINNIWRLGLVFGLNSFHKTK